MNRIDRLFGVLTLLQSKKSVSAGFLANKFQISTRTVYRDIRALEELGIPVGCEQPGGYFIVQGFFLPPLSLTMEEASALILMASLSKKFADKSIDRHCQNALYKLRAVLRYSDKEKAEFMASNISIWSSPEEKTGNEYLSIVQKAIVDRIIINIEYTNNHGQCSERKIEPIGLTFYSNQWHLIAWCWKRKEYRDFKLKMISKLKAAEQSFNKTDHISVNDYLRQLK